MIKLVSIDRQNYFEYVEINFAEWQNDFSIAAVFIQRGQYCGSCNN